MGMLRPTRGTVTVLGKDVFAEPLAVKQRVGYVPDLHHMDRWMRVREAIGFCRSLFEAWNDQTCRELLELFELDPAKKVRHLSKGMLVKLSLILAVSHDPELLILDEPMAGLDPLGREEFLDGVLRTICERGQTVIFSTHSLDDVQRLADTVGILYGGKLLVHRNIEELLAASKRIRATLTNGKLPEKLPENIIWQKVQGRELLITLGDFQPQQVEELRSQPGVEHAEVIDLGLEELFKDFIRGRKGVPL
jgi:ABC-2 type transport system ATP-binding protein